MSDNDRHIGKKQINTAGRGLPVDDGPDSETFTDRGYTCYLNRVAFDDCAGFDGWVCLPYNHPWYGRGPKDPQLKELGVTISKPHTEEEDEDTGWIVGFSTASNKYPPAQRTRDYAKDKIREIAGAAVAEVAKAKLPLGWGSKETRRMRENALDKKIFKIRDSMPGGLPAEKWRPLRDGATGDGFRLGLFSVTTFGTDARGYVVMLYSVDSGGTLTPATVAHGQPAVYEFSTFIAARLAFDAMATPQENTDLKEEEQS